MCSLIPNSHKIVYNINNLIKDIGMEIVKDLGMVLSGTGKRSYRKSIFFCPSCEKEVELWNSNGKRAKTCKPCGALKHGMSNTSVYKTWQMMINRCTNKNYDSHERYQYRKPPEKWNTFQGFWDDMEDGYIEGMSLERVDNDKPYSKENCIWADRYTQAQNQTNRPVNSSSGYYGIQKNYRQFEANIQAFGVKHYLGLFKTAKEAAMVRDKFITDNNTKHRLNFPKGVCYG